MSNIQGNGALGNLEIQISRASKTEQGILVIDITLPPYHHPPSKRIVNSYKIWIIIRHTQVLFT